MRVEISNILSAVILYSVCMGACCAEPSAGEPIDTDTYLIHPTLPEKNTRLLLAAETVKCRSEAPAYITIDKKEFWTNSIEETRLQELSADLGIGFDAYGIEALARIRNALMKKTKNIDTRVLGITIDRKGKIEPLTCYDQYLDFNYDEKCYTWKTLEKRRFRDPKPVDPLKWCEPSGIQYKVRAVYNEECANQCRLRDSKKRLPSERVKNDDDEEAAVLIKFSKTRSYEIPLYFDNEYNLIEPWPFLPKEKRCFILTDRGLRPPDCPPPN